MDPDRRSVRETYDHIAEHFATTREYPWPEVESFCADRSAGTALDVGCGNGRHAELLADHADRVVGLDVSRPLLRIAADRVPTTALVEADAARLPIADGVVDLAVYVATLHHLPSRELRRRSLDELERVLDDDGVAIVSAWSTAHDRFGPDADASHVDNANVDADPDTDAADTDTDPAETDTDPAKTDTDIDSNNTVTDDSEGFDTEIDWTLPDGETVPRFYHIYSPAEFDADLEASALVIERSWVSSGNCYAVVASR